LNAGSSKHTYQPPKVNGRCCVIIAYLSVTYFQFQFPHIVCFYIMRDRTWTTNFCFFDSQLSWKKNFSTYS